MALITFAWQSLKKNVQLRSSHRMGSLKKVYLEISQNSQKNNCTGDSFNITLQTTGLQLY